jgi:adenylosuccinate lyase
VAAGLMVKQEAGDNDLLLRLADDPRLPLNGSELTAMIGDYRQFTGRACQQTEEFLAEYVRPILEKNKESIGTVDASLRV